MNDKMLLDVDCDINNGVVEKAYLVLNGTMYASGVKVTFSNLRLPLDSDGAIAIEDPGSNAQ